jgi:hypothetical protein
VPLSSLVFSSATADAAGSLSGVAGLTELLSLDELGVACVGRLEAEVADSHWLEEYESQYKPADSSLPWPMHGRAWSAYRNSIDPKIGLFRFFWRFRGFQVWSWGLAMFGVAALVVLLLTAIRPELLA